MTPAHPTRILGIDPGTGVVGYGVVESGGPGRLARLVECGVIRTNPRRPLPARLLAIHEGLEELLARHQPSAMAVEDIFYGTNVRTTAVLGHARGVILLAGARAGVAVHEYPPATIKKAIAGRGGALKPQVGFMVAKLLGLKTAPTPADAADGVAVALTCLLGAGRLGGRTGRGAVPG
ncbi:MAG: crossover junction endodeoxyribonuclease RuvC [Gemmatimonadetes bacterium]|nr:crossover junction endodeoxyribonuclease RuvC [Gemmatimonadota bacterium]